MIFCLFVVVVFFLCVENMGKIVGGFREGRSDYSKLNYVFALLLLLAHLSQRLI